MLPAAVVCSFDDRCVQCLTLALSSATRRGADLLLLILPSRARFSHSAARRPEAPSVLAELSSLWQQIDIVHSAVQRLQNYFVNMQQTPSSSSASGTQPAPPPGPHSYTTHTPTPNLGLGTGKGSTPSSPPSRSPAAPERPSDHYVLLAVRADTRLVDLVNLMHEFLGREDIVDVWGEGKKDEWVLVMKMREESEMRVRKCLKLVA